MITLNNPKQIVFYGQFITDFQDTLNALYTGPEIIIYLIDKENPHAQVVAIGDDPFATNVHALPYRIVMNVEACNLLALEEDERYAMVFHEIGHILDPTIQQDNSIQREINADSFAVSADLRTELINGLRKLFENDKYVLQHDSISQRIAILSNIN